MEIVIERYKNKDTGMIASKILVVVENTSGMFEVVKRTGYGNGAGVSVAKMPIRPYNPARTFITAMGGWFWMDREGNPIEGTKKWMGPVDQIFDKFNDAFKIYGAGRRWDLKDGKVIKSCDW